MTKANISARDDYLQPALEAFEKGDFQEARKQFQAILDAHPKDATALHMLGVIYTDLKEYDLAQTLISRSIAYAPEDAAAHVSLGNVYQAQKQLTRAMKCYEKAVQIDPENFNAQNNLGVLYKHKERFEESIACHKKSIYLKPSSVVAHCNLASALIEAGEYDDALIVCGVAANIDSSYADVCFNMGCAFQKRKDYRFAANAFAKAVELKPDYMQAYNNLGSVFVELGELEKAVAAYVKAITIGPLHGTMCKNLANALGLLGRTDEAVKACTKAVEFAISKPRRKHKATPPVFSDSAKQKEALLDLARLMAEHEISFFLCFGTLLGFVREGGFLSFDKDIDVGIPEGYSQQKVVDIIKNSDHFSFSHKNTLNEKSLLISLKHSNGASVDLFFHFKEGDNIFAGVDNAQEQFLWKFSAFDLTEVSFLGETFRIPAEPEAYLEQMYGSWKEPDPYFNSFICAPNIVNKKSNIIKLKALHTLYTAIEMADYKKAANYCAQLAQVFPDEPVVGKVKTFLEQ